MVNRQLALRLAKVLIAAAWADGHLGDEELNAVKELIFRLPKLSEEDWDRLEGLMSSPVSELEAGKLVDELVASVHTDEDKALVIASIEGLVECDGRVSPAEQKLLDHLNKALKARKTGMLASLTRLFRHVLGRP